ncbi:beta-lactamase-like protein 2 [Colletotrichum plurivorum]|uniref:Beta-lactamase-like protein 2 n=1 Tax=Colletotrichum plurivorum TaxID=2175906 RepID=A0A8H6K9U0_9PEZI|nr:beta-lactamase-like protein 2 [Colletotrichum plurivorum]
MRSQTILTTSLSALTAAQWTCPPLGAVLPTAQSPGKHPAVRAALDAFAAALEAETSTFRGSAVSIGVKSALEDEPMLEFHHTPTGSDPQGAQTVDGATVYRLASVSKVFTVLAALQRDDLIRWEDPVTKFIPELAGDVPGGELDYTNWDDVTVEALATHLSGIGAEMFAEVGAYPGDWEALGLPPLPEDEDKPSCGGLLDVPACTREEFLSVYKNRRGPNYPVYQTPVYANPGTALVGLIVEAATGKSMEQVYREAIFEPAGMTNTFYPEAPEDLGKMFIPINDTMYKYDIGVFAPAGALYSSTDDMLKFGDAILRNQLLSGPKTRRWFKPVTFTSATGSFVGKPWEGWAANNLTGDGRIIEVYHKGGDISPYHSGFTIIPEYNLSISILVAGREVSGGLPYVQLKLNDLLPQLIKALDAAAQEEAEAKIVGTYADEASGSRVTLRRDGGWGLRLEDWVMRGFDVIPNFSRYNPMTVNLTEEQLPPDNWMTVRAYPTGLREGNRAAWRAVFDSFPPEMAGVIDSVAFWSNASCVTWLLVDRVSYGYNGLDAFEFSYGEDGRVASVLPKAFAVELKRVEGGH